MRELDKFETLKEKYRAEVSDTIEHTQINYWEKIHHPFTGGIELTPQCNLNCVHCYLQGGEKNRLMSTGQVKIIIDKLYDKGVLFLYFTGGEIFTRKDLLELYIYTKRKGFIVDLLTNATLIDQNVIDVLNKYPPGRVSISMYGASEETYSKVTRKSGYFEKCRDAILQLTQNSIQTEVKFIALKQNIDDFYAVEKFAKSVDADFSFTFEIFPTLSGDGATIDNMLSIDDIIQFESNYEVTSRIWSANISEKNKYADLPSDEVPLYMCNIGTSSFLIDYQGYLNPCNKMRMQKYNLLECDFDDAWRDFSKLKKIKAPADFKCAKCKNISICSPCPVQNMWSTGDPEVPRTSLCELTSRRVQEFSQSKYDKYREEMKKRMNQRLSDKINKSFNG